MSQKKKLFRERTITQIIAAIITIIITYVPVRLTIQYLSRAYKVLSGDTYVQFVARTTPAFWLVLISYLLHVLLLLCLAILPDFTLLSLVATPMLDTPLGTSYNSVFYFITLAFCAYLLYYSHQARANAKKG